MQQSNNILSRIIGVMALVGLLSLSFTKLTYADNSRVNEAQQLVNSLIIEVQALSQVGFDPKGSYEAIYNMVDKYFDYERIARFSAGNAWRSATDDQKARYKQVFRFYLVRQAAVHLQKFSTLEFRDIKSREQGKFLIVESMLHDKSGKRPDSNLKFRLYGKLGEPLRIFDIEIENISMVNTQRGEFTSVLNANGGDFEVLIQKIQELAEK